MTVNAFCDMIRRAERQNDNPPELTSFMIGDHRHSRDYRVAETNSPQF